MPSANPESPKMFDSPFVDYFSRTHFLVVPALYVPAVLVLLWYSVTAVGVSALATLLLFVGGAFAWTLSEYWLHRLFFHWVPKASWGPRVHFLVHGVHHQWPRDRYRLVMPPAVSIALFVLFLSFYRFTLGATYAWAFHAGYVFGYLYYDLTHYYIHHGRPLTAYGRRLRRHHMLHHFKSPDARFGVSVTFWDHVFGTVAGRAAQPLMDGPASLPEITPARSPDEGHA